MPRWLRTSFSEFNRLLLALYTATVNICHVDGKVRQNIQFCEEITTPAFFWLLISKQEGLKPLWRKQILHYSDLVHVADSPAWKYVKCVQLHPLSFVSRRVCKVTESAYYLLPVCLSLGPSALVYNNWIPIARVCVKFTIADDNWNLSGIYKFG
jgi:hypothetical protein